MDYVIDERELVLGFDAAELPSPEEPQLPTPEANVVVDTKSIVLTLETIEPTPVPTPTPTIPEEKKEVSLLPVILVGSGIVAVIALTDKKGKKA